MTSRRELTDAFVIKWEFDQDVWGVALEFANGQHNYRVGNYNEAVAEMLRVLTATTARSGASGKSRTRGTATTPSIAP